MLAAYGTVRIVMLRSSVQMYSNAALVDLIANGHGLAYQIAETYAVRGEKDKAFEWLHKGLDAHDTGMLGLLVDPLLRDLRSDPRYQALIAKMNFTTVQ